MKVIAVDDVRLLLEDFVEQLKKIDEIEEVTGFLHEEEALEYCNENPVDVAFLDIQMGEMGGIALAEELARRKPTMNIIFITAYPEYGLPAMQLHASGYLLKPPDTEQILEELHSLRYPVKTKKHIYIRTFGGFDVFVDGNPISFHRQKSREMLACMVDRRGAACSRRELAAILFEDQPYDRSIQYQLQVFKKDLVRDLEQAGAEKILVEGNNGFGVDQEKFDCDLYEFLAGNQKVIAGFTGTYMSSYSWAEDTCGELVKKKTE